MKLNQENKPNSFSSKQFKQLFLFIYFLKLALIKIGTNPNEILQISPMLSSREVLKFQILICVSHRTIGSN